MSPYSSVSQVDGVHVRNGLTAIPMLSLQWSWLHACLAFSCDKNRITSVVNGIKIVDKEFQRNEGKICPNDLVGNLVLQKGFLTKGTWNQILGKVTNLNIFFGLMPAQWMIDRTSGGDCGKQDGDYLSWANSSWSIQGEIKWTEVSVGDLCPKDSSIQLFTTHRMERPEDCAKLCQTLHKNGTMASVGTSELFHKLGDRLRSISNVLEGVNINVWVPLTKKNNSWVDIKTGNKLSKPGNWTI